MNFKRILVTTDFSEVSTEAFSTAAAQAESPGASITLLNVSEQFELPYELRRVIWDPNKIDDLEKRYVAAAKEELEKLAEKHFPDSKVKCVSLFTKQPAAKVICDFAAENNIDLIVMSSHGRGFFGKLIIGSTVQKVLGEAPCPVLVVRNKSEKGETKSGEETTSA